MNHRIFRGQRNQGSVFCFFILFSLITGIHFPLLGEVIDSNSSTPSTTEIATFAPQSGWEEPLASDSAGSGPDGSPLGQGSDSEFLGSSTTLFPPPPTLANPKLIGQTISNFAPDFAISSPSPLGNPGRIAILGDDWPNMDYVWPGNGSPERYSLNVFSWLTKGKAAPRLLVDPTFLYRGPYVDVCYLKMLAALTGHGYSYIVSGPNGWTLEYMKGFDAVLLFYSCAPVADLDAYIKGGGSAYILGGFVDAPSVFNQFLQKFDMSFSPVLWIGYLWVTNFVPHQVTNGVSSLLTVNGNPINILSSKPKSLCNQGGANWLVIYETEQSVIEVSAIPDTLWLDRNGVGSISFRATTSEEMNVTFKVQSGNQVLTSNTVYSGPSNSALWPWNGQLPGGLIAPGSYTIVAAGPTNQVSAPFEVKEKIEVTEVKPIPPKLFRGVDGITTGIIFRATVNGEADVTYEVSNVSGGQSYTIGTAHTTQVGSNNIASLTWWGEVPGITLLAGNYNVVARVGTSHAENTFILEEARTLVYGLGTWLSGKDPSALQPNPRNSLCPSNRNWPQIKAEKRDYLNGFSLNDPVNAVTGNLVYPEVDLSLKGKQKLVLARIFNSLDPEIGPFGRGWSSPFSSRLLFNNQNVVFVNSDGSRTVFQGLNGQYIAPDWADAKLTFSADTGFWTIAQPEGENWTFDSQGKIIRMTQACCGMGAADALDFEYNQAGLLTKVSAPGGLFFQLTYNQNNLIVAVADSTQRSVSFSYSDQSNLVGFINPIGQETSYGYDSNGFLTSVSKPGGRTTSFQYLNRRVSSIINPENQTTTFQWDLDNKSLSLTSAEGTNHRYGFDQQWQISKYEVPALGITKTFTLDNMAFQQVTNSQGQATQFAYGPDKLVSGKTDSLGNTTLFEYHPTFHQITKITDAIGREWLKTWCPRGNLLKEVDPAGGFYSFTYDAHNNRVSKTDPLGRLQRWVYDGSGNYLIQAIDPEGGISSFSYDNRGNLVSSSDQLGRTTLFSFDLLDRLVKTIYADGRFVEVEYNGAGNVSVRRDNLGRETHYIYDLADRLTTLTRPDGTTFNYVYSAAGQKISETDSLGRVTRFEYSPIGLLTRTTYPDSSFETMTYDTESRLVSKTNELGQTTNLEYDQLGRLLATIDPSGARWESQFDSVGRKITDKDPLNRVTAYQFDNLDRITKVIRPDNSFVTSSFDAVGNLLSTVDALGEQWSWVYDNLNRQVSAIQPNGASSRTAFDAAGQVIEETDALNRTTRFSFDNGGRRTATTDALSNIWLNFYDGVGRLTAVKDPLGAVSSMSYDIRDRVISQSDALGNVNSFEFDSAGRRVAKTDTMGRRSITAYDLRDRVTSEVDPEGHTVSFGYNLAGQRVSLTDGANRTWRWEFDNLGRITAEFDPLGNVNRSTFDSVGNRISSTNARNQTTTYAFNSMNRLSQISYPDSTIATMAYDLEGREISRSGVSGTVTKTWDSVGNMTSEAFGPWGKKWQYSFDLAGNRTQAIDPEGQIFKYTADKLNRLVELDPPDKGDEIKFSFDAAGRPVTEERPGVKTTNTFDLAGRLLEMRHERDHGREKIVALRQYQYNSVGTRISQMDENGEKTLFSFNNSDWLTKAVYPDGQQVSYTYNGAGDRISETTDTPTVKKVGRNTVLGTDTVVIPLVYDAGGRLVSRASDTFSFDSDGNQVAAVENGDETRCFWSPDNRLVKVEKDIECPKHGKKKCHQCPQIQTYTVSESYAYLPNDWRRISRTADGKEYVSVFDSADESHEYQLKTSWDKDEDDDWRKCPGKDRNKPRLKLVRQFIGGPGTDDLELTRYHGRKLWTLKDGLGSTIALTNRGGNAVARIGYDAWGSLRWPDKPGHGVKPCRDEDLDDLLDRLDGGRSFEFSHDGHHYGRHFNAVFNPYLFTGRKIDAFSELYNNRNRYYSPKGGRFVSKDMLGFKKEKNLFWYAKNNPIRFADPTGQFSLAPQSNNAAISSRIFRLAYGKMKEIVRANEFTQADHPRPTTPETLFQALGWGCGLNNVLSDISVNGREPTIKFVPTSQMTTRSEIPYYGAYYIRPTITIDERFLELNSSDNFPGVTEADAAEALANAMLHEVSHWKANDPNHEYQGNTFLYLLHNASFKLFNFTVGSIQISHNLSIE